MTTPSDLADIFGNLDLASANIDNQLEAQLGALSLSGNSKRKKFHHVLTFDYPAMDLLSHGDAIILTDPYLINWRPRPDQLNFHLDAWGSLEFFHVMDTNAPKLNTSQVASKKVKSFLDAVEALGDADGHTTLSAVVHFDGACLRLSTTSNLGNSSITTWDLTPQEWEIVMSAPCPWVDVLDDVVRRKTTRSYLAVEEKLAKTNPVLCRNQDEYLRDRWQRNVPRSGSVLLNQVLRDSNQESNDMMTIDDQNNGAVRLPCGHYGWFSNFAMDDQTCREAACTQCNKLVLPPAMYEEATMLAGLEEVVRIGTQAKPWRSLDVAISDKTVKIFDTYALSQALSAAMQSLRLPEIVEATHMSPVSFTQTSLASTAIRQWLEKEDGVIYMSPLALYAQLKAIAVKSTYEAGYAMVATWGPFLQMALKRVVNIAMLRRCADSDDGHIGVHAHDNNLHVRVVSPFSFYDMLEEEKKKSEGDVDMDSDENSEDGPWGMID